MDLDKLDIIQVKMTVLDLKAGDVLAVRLPPGLGVNEATAVHNTVKGLLPPGVKIMTFRGEVGLDVIKAAPESEPSDASQETGGGRRKRGADHAER